jgi:hypothetical protein
VAQVEKKEPKGIMTKVVAGIFTAVVAPVLVAVGVKWLDPSTWKAAPATQTAQAGQAQGPWNRRHLQFDIPGNLTDNFVSYGWSADSTPQANSLSASASPFEMIDAKAGGGIRARPGRIGSLTNKVDCDNYVLTLEYQWGTPSQGKPRTAAVRVHMTGLDAKHPDGAQGLAILLNEGNAGAVRLLGDAGKIQAVCKCKNVPLGNNRYCRVYDPSAPDTPVSTGNPTGWDGTICRLGVPTAADPARPGGWNKLAVTCMGDTVTVSVNDQPTCQLTKLKQAKGRIALTTEQAMITYRQVHIQPLDGKK